MKRITSYLVCTFVALVLIGTLTTCVPEFNEPGDGYAKNGGLSISATVSDATVVTKTPYVEALKEKQLNTLDVFVEPAEKNANNTFTGTGSFIKQYHLVGTTENPIEENDLNKLADYWIKEGLSIGNYYNIYVAVNNTQTKDEQDLTIFNVEVLKNLVADEKTDGIAVIQDDGTIGWKGNSTSGNIYKLYDANPGDARALTSEKAFMMDGFLEGWTPDPTVTDQVFPVTLNRAAAKFVLNVSFNEDFVKSLTQTKKTVEGQETWVDRPAKDQVFITGEPAWKFYNFAFGAPVFAPATQGAGIEVHNSGFNIFHNQSCEGGTPFTITTYSYPNKWDAADYATKAPSMVISVGFREYKNFNANGEPIITGNDNNDYITNYHYYRIPLVKSTVTEIERNHIYVINAEIATKGSATMEDQHVTENIQYAVLHWNDQSNSVVHQNDVESVLHMYLKVYPKVYTLHGDNDQSVIINYLKSTGTAVGWKLFTINTTTGVKGDAVASTAPNAVWGWFYDKNGNMKTSYSNWTHMGVSIEQSDEGIDGSKGTVTVTSTALDNRAIKYMLLRVYLIDSPDLYEDVLIRHFPTDNIQSIEGLWSSYHTGVSSRVDTWDPVADGWEPGTYASEEVEVSATDPYERSEVKYDGTPTNHDATDYRYQYTTGQNGSTVQTQYRSNVTQGVNRYRTNGETNAALGADGYWYWGDTRTNGSNNNYDWRGNDGTSWTGTRYRWTNYYRSKYKKTHYYRTRYYREIIVTKPETGNWVDWERDAGKSGTAKTVERDDELFHAYIFSDGTVHYLNSSNSNNASIGTSVGNRYNNNHMYVVQISATSNKYVLGKPILGNPDANRSKDDVVSPAFMIASQLGIVSTGWSSASAAEHCSKYLEVAEDGMRYAGWRLPTDDEIKIINEYQRGRFGNITIPEADRVMDYVLKGSDYFNLSGGTTHIDDYTGNQGNFLRCVRDLSSEEIERLNGFDAIIEKYR